MSEISSFLIEEDDADEYAGGGFEEPSVDLNADEEAEAEPETEEAAEEPDAETAEGPETEPEPQQTGPDYRMLYAAQNEQINNLRGQLDQLKQEMATRPEPRDEDYQYATEDEWAEDPNAAMLKNLKAERAKERTEAQKTQQVNQQSSQLEQQHETAWRQVVATVPDFAKDGHPLRQAWAAAFYNPANGFQNDPNGPVMAAAHVIRATGYQPQAQKPREVSQAEARGASQERERQARVKTGAMHGSGRGNSRKVTMLDDNARRIAKQFGVSEEAYAASFQEAENG